MAVGSRVVFTRFASAQSTKLTPWQHHSSRVTGYPAADVPELRGAREDPGALVWHLISGNNRMLARSARIFGSLPEAALNAASAAAAARHLAISHVDDGRGERGWYATLADVPILTCARWYISERDRRNSIESALTSLEIATLRPEATLMSSSRTGR